MDIINIDDLFNKQIKPKKKEYRAAKLSVSICKMIEINNFDFYIHMEGTNKYPKIKPDNINVSTLFGSNKKFLLNSLEFLEKYSTSYVILPAYTFNNDDDTINDFQLFISGGCSENEPTTVTSRKEIAEELGIYVTMKDIIYHEKLETSNKNNFSTISIYKPGKIKPINPDLFVVSNQYNKTKEKILTWVLVDKPKYVIYRQRLKSRDKAGKFVVITHVSNLIKLIHYYL
jgi:hypothetical protein